MCLSCARLPLSQTPTHTPHTHSRHLQCAYTHTIVCPFLSDAKGLRAHTCSCTRTRTHTRFECCTVNACNLNHTSRVCCASIKQTRTPYASTMHTTTTRHAYDCRTCSSAYDCRTPLHTISRARTHTHTLIRARTFGLAHADWDSHVLWVDPYKLLESDRS